MADAKDLKDCLELIMLNGGDCYVCLKIFSDTPLRETSYIKVRELEEFFKYGYTSSKPFLYHKKIDEDDKTTWNFKKREDEDRLSVDDLLEHDKAMLLYAKKYFNEYTV